jgi:hypothetical protein
MHANSDGLVFAATAHSSVYSSDPDAPDIEIGHRPTHLVLLIALGFAMTLLSASLAFEMWGELGGSTTAGCAGVILFGLGTCRLIWMLPAERGAVVVVTPYGIRDLRIGNEFLLWDSIETVSARESRGRGAVVLTLIPALRQQRTCPRGRRDASSDKVVISLDGLATDVETLLRICRAFHGAGEHGTASQQRRDCKAQSFAVPAS